jgi:hypothetical protein
MAGFIPSLRENPREVLPAPYAPME